MHSAHKCSSICQGLNLKQGTENSETTAARDVGLGTPVTPESGKQLTGVKVNLISVCQSHVRGVPARVCR